MQYRTFPKTGQALSLLGFGSMRLPLNGDGSVNEDLSIKMIRSAIDQGVNYVDTAYMYHGGESEKVVGKALKDGYREKVCLADKMPIWLVKEPEGMEDLFNKQFDRLDTDIIDMYLVHNMNRGVWRRAEKFGLMPFLEEKKTAGKIKHLGFSFHDDFDFFKDIIDAYPWDFCQIQLNYMDIKHQAGVDGLKYAASKGIPVIIMEPLKGGKLTDILPPSIEAFWQEADIKRSPAEWALRWVADFPEVMLILSGMHSMEQVDENIRVLSDAVPGSLTEKEQGIISKVSESYNQLIQYSCTACGYCMPCPRKIDIPRAIGLYNDWFLYDKNPKVKADFETWMPPERRPSDCVACKVCEGECPQHLPIAEIMKKAKEVFE